VKTTNEGKASHSHRIEETEDALPQPRNGGKKEKVSLEHNVVLGGIFLKGQNKRTQEPGVSDKEGTYRGRTRLHAD